MTSDTYLAILAPVVDPEEARRVAERASREFQLVPAFEGEGLTVLVRAATRHRLFGEAGIAIGTAIGSSTDATTGSGTGPFDGHGFVEAFWGDYVAFFRPPGSGEIAVIRAPSGRLPAFRTALDGITLVASDPAMLLALAGTGPRIDWRFLAHHLAFPHLRCAATGLAGIDELFAGDRTIFGGKGARRETIWSPWDFAAPERQIADMDEARRTLRKSVHQATERLYHCILLVTTFYTPHVHNIGFLRTQAERLDRRLVDVWPRERRIDQARWEKLKEAYVKARYSKHYKISEVELAWLGKQIEELGRVVHEVCAERLAELRRTAGVAA